MQTRHISSVLQPTPHRSCLACIPTRLPSRRTHRVQQDPHIFQNVRVLCFDPTNPTHLRLSELSRKAHAISAGESMENLGEVEREVDECAANLWGLTAEELEAVRRSLKE